MKALPLSLSEAISQRVSESIGEPFSIDHHRAISGGDIHQSYLIRDTLTQQSYFVKINTAKYSALFAAEVQSLRLISRAESIKAPAIIATGSVGAYCFLVLEYLSLNTHGDEFVLGQQLASMHSIVAPQFGFETDNFIGLTPQKNTFTKGWCEFFRDCRLLPQLEMAYKQAYADSLKVIGEQLLKKLPDIFGDHLPKASLVHGDLWSGNAAFLDDGTPVIYDPACYYGDREVDLAMTRLFGGFGSEFYRGYATKWPLPAGYKTREPLYNLYHQLNHLNLFGSAYLNACVQSIKALL